MVNKPTGCQELREETRTLTGFHVWQLNYINDPSTEDSMITGGGGSGSLRLCHDGWKLVGLWPPVGDRLLK